MIKDITQDFYVGPVPHEKTEEILNKIFGVTTDVGIIPCPSYAELLVPEYAEKFYCLAYVFACKIVNGLGPEQLTYQNRSIFSLNDVHDEESFQRFWHWQFVAGRSTEHENDRMYILYLWPRIEENVNVTVIDTHFSGLVCADAAGLIVSIYAWRELFRTYEDVELRKKYTLLRNFARHHQEAKIIDRAVD